MKILLYLSISILLFSGKTSSAREVSAFPKGYTAMATIDKISPKSSKKLKKVANSKSVFIYGKLLLFISISSLTFAFLDLPDDEPGPQGQDSSHNPYRPHGPIVDNENEIHDFYNGVVSPYPIPIPEWTQTDFSKLGQEELLEDIKKSISKLEETINKINPHNTPEELQLHIKKINLCLIILKLSNSNKILTLLLERKDSKNLDFEFKQAIENIRKEIQLIENFIADQDDKFLSKNLEKSKEIFYKLTKCLNKEMNADAVKESINSLKNFFISYIKTLNDLEALVPLPKRVVDLNQLSRKFTLLFFKILEFDKRLNEKLILLHKTCETDDSDQPQDADLAKLEGMDIFLQERLTLLDTKIRSLMETSSPTSPNST